MGFSYHVDSALLPDPQSSNLYASPRRLIDLLGPQRSAKIHLSCEDLFGSGPLERTLTLEEASNHVVGALERDACIDDCGHIKHRSGRRNWLSAWQSA